MDKKRAAYAPYQIENLNGADLRGNYLKGMGMSLESLDLRDKSEFLRSSVFDTLTEWPPKERLPEDFNPLEIMKMCQNPGLGVRKVHNAEITGKGVNVAIIDQPLLMHHEEYKDKVMRYTKIDCGDAGPQMHGAAVASLLVGENCGTAPDASLFYWAAPLWKRDYLQSIKAMKEIIEYNREQHDLDKIRVVSISKGYDDAFKNLAKWKSTIEDAEREELIVVHCGGEIAGLNCPLYKDVDDPKNYDVCNYARELGGYRGDGLIYVPIDNRTVASPEGDKDYVFWPYSGLSWGAPYLAGVIALGLQVKPDMKPDEVIEKLHDTGTSFNDGWMVNPRAFVERAMQ